MFLRAANWAFNRSVVLSSRRSRMLTQRVSISRMYGKETEGSAMGIVNISDSCVRQLLLTVEQSQFLRVTVEGGGCSGFQYTFALDNTMNADDVCFEREGAKVVVDSLSLSFVAGATVDFQDELIRSAFRIVQNPLADAGCSCGVSFALKMPPPQIDHGET